MTYALSIIAESQDTDYLIRNASWLAGICSLPVYILLTNRLNFLGSGLTVFLDILVRAIASGHKPNSLLFTMSPNCRCCVNSFTTDLFQDSEVVLMMEVIRKYSI